MSSFYLCGSMALLSEKEAVKNWEASEMFQNMIPKEATAHSLDYLPKLVLAERRKILERERAQRQQQQLELQQKQREKQSAAEANAEAERLRKEQEELERELLALDEQEHLQKNADDDDDNDDDDAEKKLKEDKAEAKKETEKEEDDDDLKLELAAEDESTLEMLVDQEELDALEVEKRKKFIAEQQQQELEQQKQQLAMGNRRLRDGTLAPSSPTTLNQKQFSADGGFSPGGDSSSSSKQQQQQTLRQLRQQVDVQALAQLLGFEPGNLQKRYRGRIKTFLFDQGYGFVQPHATVDLAKKKEAFDLKMKEQQQQQQVPSASASATAKESSVNKDNNNKDDDAAQKQQQEEEKQQKDDGEEAETKQQQEQENNKDEKQSEEETQLAALQLPPSEIEIFISAEDVLNLNTSAMENILPVQQAETLTPHQQQQTLRALKMPIPGEEVEFSITIAQTHHGKSLRAVRLTGPNGSPLLVQMPTMRQRGVVRLWDNARRFGFIAPISGPPAGLAGLSEGRLLPDAIQTLKKPSNDVFTLASNVVWDPSVPVHERALPVGCVVEYTAVLRKNASNKNDNNSSSNNNSAARGGRNQQRDNNRNQNDNQQQQNRLIAICITDFGYRSCDPQIVERVVSDLPVSTSSSSHNQQQQQNNNNMMMMNAMNQNQQQQVGSSSSSAATQQQQQQQQAGGTTTSTSQIGASGKIESHTLSQAIANGTLMTARPGVMGTTGSAANMMSNVTSSTGMGMNVAGSDKQQQQGGSTKEGGGDASLSAVADLFGGNIAW